MRGKEYGYQHGKNAVEEGRRGAQHDENIHSRRTVLQGTITADVKSLAYPKLDWDGQEQTDHVP